MNRKKIAFQILFALLLCVVIESICWFVLHWHQQEVGFLINLKNNSRIYNAKQTATSDQLDPLCGWAISDQKLKAAGFEVEQNCVVLRSKGEYPVKPLRIFITGGSTSDIFFDKEAWPQKLYEILQREKINAIVYVGAMYGYGSGQELFRLLRDGLEIKPDIHISYSGANDLAGANYVSDYGWDFYKTGLRNNVTTPVLPNTVLVVKKIFQFPYSNLSLPALKWIPAYDFWRQNMIAMKGLAAGNEYKYIGILQPVLSTGKYRYNTGELFDEDNKEYGKYYPRAKQYILEGDSSLYDFTAVFDTATGKVYRDNCHVTPEYQPVIAKEVFRILKAQKIL